VDDPVEAAAELRRCAANGLAGGLIPVALPPGTYYDDLVFDPLWRTAVELDIPLSLHIGTERASKDGGGFTDDLRSLRPATMVNQDHSVRNSLTDLILGGVFERWPTIHIGSVEYELGWAPFFVERLDYTYQQRARRKGWHRFDDPDALPSDYFRRNVFVSFQSDALGIGLRDHFGSGMLLWGSDYPHTESTYPRSRSMLDELLRSLASADRVAITRDNTVRLYGFDLGV
jgi:predicted TIM-barrel fold metal-dependent hydrolase